MHRGRRLRFAALATLALLTSWVVAWIMPSPQICKTISCGAGFNPGEVTWHQLSFLNWPQMIVLVLGAVAFVVLMVLALWRPGRQGQVMRRPV